MQVDTLFPDGTINAYHIVTPGYYPSYYPNNAGGPVSTTVAGSPSTPGPAFYVTVRDPVYSLAPPAGATAAARSTPRSRPRRATIPCKS